MLTLTRDTWLAMVGHAYEGLPDEACGLIATDPTTGSVQAFYPCENVKRSSRVFGIGPKDWAAAEDDADRHGLALAGVVHSHTHTEAWPSPTDIDAAQAYEGIPEWHHLIVSLKRDAPVVRSYQIVEGKVSEEPIALG